MGVCNSPDIYRKNEQTNPRFWIRVYLDYLLVLTTSNWTNHLTKLENYLRNNKKKDENVIQKRPFSPIRNGILKFICYMWRCKANRKKIDVIVNIYPPRNRKEVLRFIEILNYYRDIWARRSHTLQSLTKLMSVCVKLKRVSVEQ